MTQWAHEHPFLTFFIVVIGVGSICEAVAAFAKRN